MSAPSTVVPHAAHPVRGVMFFCIALFLFACLDTSVKYLAQHHPVPLIAWARYIVHLLLMVALLGPLQGRLLLQTQRTGLAILRALCLVAITLCMMFALRRLPLAEATSLTFVAPMLAVLLARPLLGERIGGVRAAAVVIGFLGVLLIARPGGSVDVTGFVLVMGVALGSAGYQLLSRVLMRTERTTTLLFYAALAGAGVFSLMLPWSLGGPTPTLLEWGLFIGVGLSGGIGHYCYTRAYRDATVSLLAPLSYLQLVWAALLGWLVFGQYPDGMSLAGMGIIAMSGVVVAFESRRRTGPGD